MSCDTYCVLADIGLGTQTNGNTTICNQSRTEFKNSQGRVLRLDTDSLEESWNSPTRQEIVHALKSGVRHENCYDCWHEEDAGRLSMRQLSNTKFADIAPLVNQPKVFMFKPGNACNLSCRHCNPFVSSGWYKDHYRAVVSKTSNITFNEYVRTYDSIRNSFDRHNENLWPILKKWNDNIIFYDLYGAEPLLIDPLLDNLRHSYKSGASQNQTIHVNTNGTIWQDDFNEVFSSFKRVELGISIDGIERQFEYMRYPAIWGQLLKNLEKYSNLSNKFSSIKLSVCITVSLLNIYYLPEYVNFFHKIGIEVTINILHRPEYLNIRIAPEKAKEKIVSKLKNSKFIVKEWDKKIAEVQNFVELPYFDSDNLYKKFWNFVLTFDELRNENFKQTFSEYYEILINAKNT